VPEVKPVKYRSSVAVGGNVAMVVFAGVLVVSSLVAISERLRNVRSDHLGVVGKVVGTVVLWAVAAAMLRISRTALEVSASSVRVVTGFAPMNSSGRTGSRCCMATIFATWDWNSRCWLATTVTWCCVPATVER